MSECVCVCVSVMVSHPEQSCSLLSAAEHQHNVTLQPQISTERLLINCLLLVFVGFNQRGRSKQVVIKLHGTLHLLALCFLTKVVVVVVVGIMTE